MTSSRPSAFSRFCAALVASALVLQPLGAYAAPIPGSSLAEIPIQGLNLVKPNIMYTMDDSGSMALQTLPDYLNGAQLLIWTGNAAIFPDKAWCRGNGGKAANCVFTSPPFASSQLNRIYYDPALSYFAGNGPDPKAAPLPCEGIDASCSGPWKAVYRDGYAGYPNANTSPTIDLTAGYPDEVFCNVAAVNAPDLATAKSDGSVCRFNAVDYGDGGGYRYPDAIYRFRKDVSGNPYYYTINKPVQFCGTKDPATGWGTDNCGPIWSPATPYVSYGAAGGFDPTAFERVEIDAQSQGFLVNGVKKATSPSGRSYADEMTNFALWYTFARTRMLAMKTAGGYAFSQLDANSRVGFNTLNSYKDAFLNVDDFTGPYKKLWFNNFYSVQPDGATPSLDAMWRVGEYFSNRGVAAGFDGTGAAPAATDPADATTGKCQSNFHLLSTDGYWFQSDGITPRSGLAGPIDNQDATVPAVLPGPVPGFTPGEAFPRPYREGAGLKSMLNVLSDIAMYYWIHDLRPNLPNQVKDAIAPWQHVVFYALSIGAEGTIPYPDGIDDITLGLKEWPSAGAFGNVAAAVDDLWHAAINARGKYFNVKNLLELAESVVGALADFTDQAGTAAAVGLTGAQITADNNFGYRTSYENGWWGDVKKYALNPATGALDVNKDGNPVNPPVWSAATQVDVQVAGNGWDVNRRIVTMKDSTPVPFRWDSLAKEQQQSLNAGWSKPKPSGADVLNFLRGDKSKEGVKASSFRVRSHALGDFVHSAAVSIAAPSLPYEDAGNPGYSDFAKKMKLRTPMVYVGGNDGMLHAFDNSSTPDGGKETWAYVPAAMFTAGDPNDTEHKPDPDFQIGSLAYRRGGIPQFHHRYLVDATPRVWDVDFKNTNTSKPPVADNDWRTILVGGLGAGGRAVYALDVTTPVKMTDKEDAIASSRVLWEFSDDDKLGYVFDAPTLVKTYRFGWVVLVASGYNNKSGKGYLFVLDPKTGKPLIEPLALPGDTGTAADPTGLSTIRAYTPSRKDPYVLQAYGGDLKGRVWRFDLSDPDEKNWKVEKIAELKDGDKKAQPITTGIRIEIDQTNNVDRYLFVGTGMMLSQGDLLGTNPVSNVTNSMYVLRDGTRTASGAVPAILNPRDDPAVHVVLGAGTTGFAGAIGRGWYQDGSPKEKIITDVVADVQTAVYVFAKPSDDACEAALTAKLVARNFVSGDSALTKSEGGKVVASIDDIGAIAGAALVQTGGNAAASGDIRVQVTTMKGQVFTFGVNVPGSGSKRHRVSWRLLNTN